MPIKTNLTYKCLCKYRQPMAEMGFPDVASPNSSLIPCFSRTTAISGSKFVCDDTKMTLHTRRPPNTCFCHYDSEERYLCPDFWPAIDLMQSTAGERKRRINLEESLALDHGVVADASWATHCDESEVVVVSCSGECGSGYVMVRGRHSSSKLNRKD